MIPLPNLAQSRPTTRLKNYRGSTYLHKIVLLAVLAYALVPLYDHAQNHTSTPPHPPRYTPEPPGNNRQKDTG